MVFHRVDVGGALELTSSCGILARALARMHVLSCSLHILFMWLRVAVDLILIGLTRVVSSSSNIR